MALVKLDIDGRRIIADSSQTILQVARQHGVGDIPTLCHDGQLEPFSSCFLCVVRVKGARSLQPACSTRVAPGMVVETSTDEVRRSRKAALELLLSNHYADCIGPCQLACPAGIDVQGYIALAAVGKYRDAVALIKERNPLPSVCGRVCTRPCEVNGCRRNLLDEAVGIDYIKRYLTDLDMGSGDAFRPTPAPSNGGKVAIVGGGPGGLSAAYYLGLRGYDVQLFEALPEAGGMLRYGIPEYRLPKDVLDLEINQVLSLGVTLRTNASLGRDFTVTSLKAQGFAAIFLAIGAWRSSLMRVQNEDAPGVLSGIEFLRNVGLRRRVELGGRVAVVGGGNTAIDCARTALRLGAAQVTLLYRRTRNEMPANQAEIRDAIEEGVAMEFLAAPVRVVSEGGRLTGVECLRMELGEPDASGRRSPKPIKGSEFFASCDVVISAIGQSTTVTDLVGGRIPGFLPPGEVLNLTRWQTIAVNEKTFETSVEGVFAGGDVVTGAATAIEAIAAGRRAAHAIDAYLTTGVARPEPEEFVSRRDAFGTVTDADLKSMVVSPRRTMPMLPVEDRIRSFAEVEQGYSHEDLNAEVQRCLECGCTALFACDLRRHATAYGVDIRRFLGEATRHKVDTSHPLIELDPNKCILCGRCVRVCAEVVGVSAFGYVNRGFATSVLPAFGGSLAETDCVSCGNCLGTCPTGAISQKIPLAKPGPWKTTPVASVCHYCGVGCRISYDVFGDTLVKVGPNAASPVTFGNQCRKGRFGFTHVQAPDRLVRGRIRPGREMQDAPVEEAIAYAAMRLKELKRYVSGREVAVFLSPRLTNEEIYLAQKVARVALGTHNVTSFSRLVNEALDAPDVVATASYANLVDAQAILVVQASLADDHFVADLAVKRSIRNGGRLIVIGPEATRTAQVAELCLPALPGTEVEVLDAIVAEYQRLSGAPSPGIPGTSAGVAQAADPDVAGGFETRTGVPKGLVREAADVLAGTILKVLVFNRDHRGPRRAGDVRLLAAAADALGAALLPLHEKANAQGLADMGASPSWYPGYLGVDDDAAVEELEKDWCVSLTELDRAPIDLAEALRQKRIKVAIVLGEDPLGADQVPEDLRRGLLAADFLVVGDLFLTETARAAHVVLPLSSSAETAGTFTNSERRVQQIRRAVPPRAGLETWELLCQLGARMGYRFKLNYGSVEEVFAEIRRVAPVYRDVIIDHLESEGLWALDRLPRAELARLAPAGGAPVPVVPTRGLDILEVRFERWFGGLFAQPTATPGSDRATGR